MPFKHHLPPGHTPRIKTDHGELIAKYHREAEEKAYAASAFNLKVNWWQQDELGEIRILGHGRYIEEISFDGRVYAIGKSPEDRNAFFLRVNNWNNGSSLLRCAQQGIPVDWGGEPWVEGAADRLYEFFERHGLTE